MYNIKSLVDLSHSLSGAYLAEAESAHSVIADIAEMIREIGSTLSPREYVKRGECIYISRHARVSEDAEIGEDVIIGHGCEVRKGAYIRAGALIGDEVVIGNSTEIKSSIIFDKCQIPHFNYVGDSILGCGAHFGAGVIASNLRSDKKPVRLIIPCEDDGKAEIIDTGLRKLGAIVGDFAEIGCNSVLCPGAIIGRRAQIYPLSLVRGFVPENEIYRNVT